MCQLAGGSVFGYTKIKSYVACSVKLNTATRTLTAKNTRKLKSSISGAEQRLSCDEDSELCLATDADEPYAMCQQNLSTILPDMEFI